MATKSSSSPDSDPDPALSVPQQRIATVLAKLESGGQPAFVPDLARALGYAGISSLTPTLRILERKGILTLQGGGSKGRPRLVRLTARGRLATGIGGLPVLGRIPAGPLREALAEPEEILASDRLLPWRTGDFLLRVTGDSMTGDGIQDGDLVLLRPDIPVAPGEIAAVYVGDAWEATLKRVHFETDHVRLRAANPRYPDMLIPATEWRGTAGVFCGLIRDPERQR